MTGEARLRLRPAAALWREVHGETIVLQLDQSQYLGVNAAGTVLWPALVAGATRDELVGRLLSAYAIGQDQAALDVDAFLLACRAHNLLEP